MKQNIRKTNEIYYVCPYCGIAVSLTLDAKNNKNENLLIEDCINCYNPVTIRFKYVQKRIVGFKVEAL